MPRPLLIVDGDSFAHRAYHALPKSIRRRGDKGAGAILGFANILLRLYDSEKPRAVLVGWDTYDAPTYRHEALESYQTRRTPASLPARMVYSLESSYPDSARYRHHLSPSENRPRHARGVIPEMEKGVVHRP
jgi:5'-3' exonuclease